VTTELLPTLPGHIPPGNHGKPVTAPAMTLSQLDTAVGRFVTQDYHRRVHPETGQTPSDRWTAGGWLPRMPESLEQLDLLLLTMATQRKVQRDGIALHGLRYFSTTLAAYIGEPVTIRYDPRDLAKIRVYHQGEYLCPGRRPRDRRRHRLHQRPPGRPQRTPPRTAPTPHRPPRPGRPAHPPRHRTHPGTGHQAARLERSGPTTDQALPRRLTRIGD